MNANTAKLLDELLDRVRRPLHLEPDGSCSFAYRICGGTETERANMAAYVESCRVRVEPQAVATEIVRAAQARRKAILFSADDDLLFWAQVNGKDKGAGGIALSLVMPEIHAEIARLNAYAETQYEDYRQACAQGVAVPPAA